MQKRVFSDPGFPGGDPESMDGVLQNLTGATDKGNKETSYGIGLSIASQKEARFARWDLKFHRSSTFGRYKWPQRSGVVMLQSSSMVRTILQLGNVGNGLLRFIMFQELQDMIQRLRPS